MKDRGERNDYSKNGTRRPRCMKDYDYELDDERNYLSWVQSRQLF